MLMRSFRKFSNSYHKNQKFLDFQLPEIAQRTLLNFSEKCVRNVRKSTKEHFLIEVRQKSVLTSSKNKHTHGHGGRGRRHPASGRLCGRVRLVVRITCLRTRSGAVRQVPRSWKRHATRSGPLADEDFYLVAKQAFR